MGEGQSAKDLSIFELIGVDTQIRTFVMYGKRTASLLVCVIMRKRTSERMKVGGQAKGECKHERTWP